MKIVGNNMNRKHHDFALGQKIHFKMETENLKTRFVVSGFTDFFAIAATNSASTSIWFYRFPINASMKFLYVWNVKRSSNFSDNDITWQAYFTSPSTEQAGMNVMLFTNLLRPFISLDIHIRDNRQGKSISCYRWKKGKTSGKCWKNNRGKRFLCCRKVLLRSWIVIRETQGSDEDKNPNDSRCHSRRRAMM